jgi:hypothetical protein
MSSPIPRYEKVVCPNEIKPKALPGNYVIPVNFWREVQVSRRRRAGLPDKY